MDTSAINDEGMGWISADHLADLDADLDADYVQADDEALYVRGWNATDGAEAWESGDVTFTDIDSVSVTSSVTGDTALDEMFNVEDVAEGTWLQVWVDDALMSTTHGNGWVEYANLGDETFTAPAAGESSEFYVRTWNSGDFGKWEDWTVTNDGGVEGDTFTLTDEIDIITPTSSQEGNQTTDGDDTITGDSGTLSPADDIDGGGGTNTFNLVLDTNANETPQLTNVQIVNVMDTTGTTVNFNNTDGVETITNDRSTAAATFSSVQTLDTTTRVFNTAVQTNVEFADSVVSGTSGETFKLEVEDAGTTIGTEAIVTVDDVTNNGNVIQNTASVTAVAGS